MSLNINTNLASRMVQYNLIHSTNGLNSAIERMTTGFNINSAKDNAAGYSIKNSMNSKISAYQVAEDNVAMGLDMLGTAEDSLSLISEHLKRIRELTIQVYNGTYDNKSTKAINSEVNARLDEIERLYSSTEYNGIKLFGEEPKPTFIEEVTKRDTSTMTALSSVDENTYISSGVYSISTTDELEKLSRMTANNNVRGGEFVLAADIDLSEYSTGSGWMPIGGASGFYGTFDGNGYVIKNLYINKYGQFGLFSELATGATVKNLGVENVNITGANVGGIAGYLHSNASIANCYVTGNIKAYDGCGGLAPQLYSSASISNSYTNVNIQAKHTGGGLLCSLMGGSVTNCYASGNVQGSTSGGLIGYFHDGIIENCYSTSVVQGDGAGGLIGQGETNVGISNSYYDKEKSGQFDTEYCEGISSAEIKEKMLEVGLIKQEESNNFVSFQVGIFSNLGSKISLNTAFSLLNISGLRNIGLKDESYLENIDSILSSISAKQTEYGACKNRLESALEEINTHYNNLVSSRSTLVDADIAEESSAYIKNQILQQASATLLATTNQSPSIALQLI